MKAKRRRRRVMAKDLTASSTGVKGGIIIDWKATSAARPGEERGVITIIKAVGGA